MILRRRKCEWWDGFVIGSCCTGTVVELFDGQYLPAALWAVTLVLGFLGALVRR